VLPTLCKISVAAVLIVGLTTAVDDRADASRSDFVGAEVCGSCHQDIYDKWAKSVHARATDTLGKDAKRAACLGCHSTGEAPAGKMAFAGVQCESCHGPGAGYSPDDVMRNPTLSRALGLRDLSDDKQVAAVCESCHRSSTRIEPFDVAKAWKAIEH
jgi:hypothetical protein